MNTVKTFLGRCGDKAALLAVGTIAAGSKAMATVTPLVDFDAIGDTIKTEAAPGISKGVIVMASFLAVGIAVGLFRKFVRKA